MLITRPLQDGQRVASRLALMGHEALLAPLLSVRFLDRPLGLDGVQAILATSANGVRAFCALTSRRDLPLFAVGPQTAAEAREAGFTQVLNAEGDTRALAESVCRTARPENGLLLHAGGAEAGSELGESLERHGFRVARKELYRIEARDRLPEEAARAMRENAIGAALFFSPRSAALFAKCALAERLPTRGTVQVSISANTARALEGLSFSEIRIAAKPNLDALLACL